MRCRICQEPTPGLHWCKSCQRSYDRASARSCDILTVVEWAADRARLFERRRMRSEGAPEPLEHQERGMCLCDACLGPDLVKGAPSIQRRYGEAGRKYMVCTRAPRCPSDVHHDECPLKPDPADAAP